MAIRAFCGGGIGVVQVYDFRPGGLSAITSRDIAFLQEFIGEGYSCSGVAARRTVEAAAPRFPEEAAREKLERVELEKALHATKKASHGVPSTVTGETGRWQRTG